MRVYTKSHLDVFTEGAAAYWSTFWETLDDLVRQIPPELSVFPSFLRPGPRAILVVLNRWGLSVASRHADEWQVTSRWSKDEYIPVDDFLAVTMPPHDEPATVEVMGFNVGFDDATGQEITFSPWHFLRTDSNVASSTFDTAAAVASAKDVALFFTTQHLLGMSGDPATTSPSDVAERIRSLTAEFEVLLDTATHEEEIQSYLTANPALIDLRAVRIIPKMRLGDDFVTDYVVELPGMEYVFVEIEAAHRTLYTGKNDPSAEMNHAVKQVEDWVEWAYDNRPYLASKLPGLHEPHGLVVMGRRRTLNEAAEKSLRRRNQMSAIKVRTFDDLIETARATASNIERFG